MDDILRVGGLTTRLKTEKGIMTPVNSLSFRLRKGQTLGIVGESGSGKSVMALSLMQLIPPQLLACLEGQVLFKGDNLLAYTQAQMREVRGSKIAMIFQDPTSSLNPVLKIGTQLAEILIYHMSYAQQEAYKRAEELLAQVGIPDPAACLDKYPHQLSGGQCQRVMIAISLVGEPDILIADEPTTALDATIQAQILELLKRLQQELEMSIIFITHDLGVVAELCHQVAVMYCGRIVECTGVEELFAHPRHPYTRGLIDAMPGLLVAHKKPGSRLQTIPGIVPSLADLPTGCAFQNRCAHVQEDCRGSRGIPPLQGLTPDHQAACFHPLTGKKQAQSTQ